MINKAIEAGHVQIDLYEADLLADTHTIDAKGTAKKQVTTTKNAEISEKVPWRVFLGHEWAGHSFEELTTSLSTLLKAQRRSPVRRSDIASGAGSSVVAHCGVGHICYLR